MKIVKRKIEKRVGRPPKYPFDDLKPGYAIIVPARDKIAKRRVAVAAHRWADRRGYKVACRTEKGAVVVGREK